MDSRDDSSSLSLQVDLSRHPNISVVAGEQLPPAPSTGAFSKITVDLSPTTTSNTILVQVSACSSFIMIQIAS